jgi:methyl-accepting chemotaxis protein
VAAASEEQSRGIDQLSVAVNQMNTVTQRNAANAEESASASEEVASQIESMREQMNDLSAVVKGGDGQTQHVAARTPARRAASTQVTRPVAQAKPGRMTLKRPEQVIPFDQEDLNKF